MSIYEQLYPFQKHIVDKFAEKKSFGIFIDMGLGKTPISLALAEKNKCTKVIIVTINSKALETKEEKGSWLYWTEQSNINYTHRIKKDSQFDESIPEVLLINYEALFSRDKSSNAKCALRKNVMSFIQSCTGHKTAIIVDESHKMKNLNSLQTLAINKIKSQLELRARKVYTYLLTGTPFTTGYIDLYSQLKTLGYTETKTQFIDQFCVRGNIRGLLGWQQPIVGYKNIDQLFDVIHRYAITIKSKDVVDLPEKIFINHTLPVSEEFKLFTSEKIPENKLFKLLDKKETGQDKKVNNPFYRDIDYPTDRWIAETPAAFHLRCRQLSIGFQGNAEESNWYDKRRLEQLKRFLIENESNYVLFYNYTPELYELFELCTDIGYNTDVYCGEIKSLKNYERFSNQSESERLVNSKNIILANFASGSTGVNWQLYNKCILFSIPLYAHYEQGIKRIHRIGQKENVQYHFFYQENWLDKAMIKALKESVNYSDEMFQSDLVRVQELSQE